MGRSPAEECPRSARRKLTRRIRKRARETREGRERRRREKAVSLIERRGYGVAAWTRRMAAMLRSTSASVVAQEETLMRMAVRPCQTVMPAQQVPSA